MPPVRDYTAVETFWHAIRERGNRETITAAVLGVLGGRACVWQSNSIDRP